MKKDRLDEMFDEELYEDIQFEDVGDFEDWELNEDDDDTDWDCLDDDFDLETDFITDDFEDFDDEDILEAEVVESSEFEV